MAKSHVRKTSGKNYSSKKANVTGYAKRVSQKPNASKKTSISEVYEFEEDPKVRRSKVKLDLEREEEAGFGRGTSDDEQSGLQKARLFGVDADEERIASEDDEEIDSDAAFEESDEDRFAGFTFQSSRRKPANKPSSHKIVLPEVDLDEEDEQLQKEDEGETSEEEEEEEEGDPSEFIDVLDFFEGRGEPEEEEDWPLKDKFTEEVSSEERSEEGDGPEDKEESEDEDIMSASDDEGSPNALDGLNEFISNLPTQAPSKKRKADADTPNTKPHKRRLLKEKTEAGPESEFRVYSSGSKLRIDDLLAPLASQSSNLASLKKSTKDLVPAKTLSAPLPQRAQERLDREAAYEQTKQEVDKWGATMKRIREAEHLSFPLQAQPEPRVSNLELTAKFKPTTKLETSVDKLLKAAQLRDDDIEKMEDQGLKAQNLTLEEVAERRAELRKMRELMFRAEAKAKRIAKIKSKTYRRIRKKERAKLAEQDEEDAETEEGRLKREVERARERATLKHRSTGKWAMEMKRNGELDANQRKDLEEMLRRGEQLKQKIQGIESGEEDESEDGDGGDDILRIKQNAFDELAQLDDDPADVDGKAKGVFKMKFMQDAMAREQAKVDRMADDFVNQMDNEVMASGSEHEGPTQSSENVHISRTGGRVIIRPGTTQPSVGIRAFTSLASDTSSVTLRSTDLQTTPPHSVIEPSPHSPTHSESNPWLARGDDSLTAKITRKKNEVVVNKDSDTLAKSKNKLSKRAKKKEAEKEKQKEDAVVEIQLDNALTLATSVTNTAPNSQIGPKDDDSDSEVENQETLVRSSDMQKTKGPKAFEQRDLVALAFAGDNVVQNFEEVKKREIAEDAPREVDITLPGWGSWGGRGTSRAPPKPHFIKKVAGIEPKSRADFGKSHVIISEKRDKKAAKYLVKDLPFPYTSKAQYDRSMEMPVGAEWNTRVGFQKATMPKVLKKPGTVISPLEKLN